MSHRVRLHAVSAHGSIAFPAGSLSPSRILLPVMCGRDRWSGQSVACGNNKIDRSMVAAFGGLAVQAAVAESKTKTEALAKAVNQGPYARNYYVLRDGTRVKSTRTGSDGKHHVHVVLEHRNMRRTAMLQITDKTSVGVKDSDLEPKLTSDQKAAERRAGGTTMHLGKSGERHGHTDRVEIFTPNRPIRDSDLRKEEAALVAKMNARLQRDRKQ